MEWLETRTSPDVLFSKPLKRQIRVDKSPFSIQAYGTSRWNTLAMHKASFLLNLAGVLTLLTGFLLPTAIQALTLTEAQEQELIRTMDSSQVTEIRRYIDACLSDQLDDPEDSYPCHVTGMEKGFTIKEHRPSDVSGAFTVIWIQPFDYVGQIFTVLFTDPPNLAVDIWVYLEGGVSPDVRSFMARDWNEEERLYLVNDLGKYLTDKRFIR